MLVWAEDRDVEISIEASVGAIESFEAFLGKRRWYQR